MEEILIKYFETKSNKELAEMLNVSETTIVRNLKKIRFIKKNSFYIRRRRIFKRYS